MLTTTEAFEKFRKNLELSDTEAKDAQRRRRDVRMCIRDEFDIIRDFLSGSYARHTKTKPLKDVDVLFVMGEQERWRRDKAPIDTLHAFKACLKKTYSDSDQVSVGRRSVSVEFEKPNYSDEHPGKILSIDAVPAFEWDGVYEIPDKVTGTWIKTNPETHAEQATAKNKALDGFWIPLVKMLRGWNRASDKPIQPSFLVEVMAEGLVDAPFSNYANEVRNFFAAAAGRIGDNWPDPAGLGPPVSDQMTAELADAARTALQDAGRLAALAVRYEQTNNQGEALRTWRVIFGPYFPLS
jgi:hypothetical protein